jgi:hypothetical protein
MKVPCRGLLPILLSFALILGPGLRTPARAEAVATKVGTRGCSPAWSSHCHQGRIPAPVRFFPEPVRVRSGSFLVLREAEPTCVR